MFGPVAILGGTGQLGFGLALRLARAGVPVIIGSRDAGRAAEAAERAKGLVPDGDLRGLENAEATTAAEKVVVIAVPFASQASTLKGLSDVLREDQIVLDATVPLGPAIGGKPTTLVGVWQGSAAQQAQSLVPAGVKVVSGLHTLSADLLTDLDHDLAQDTLICGDRKADKAVVIELLSVIDGLRCVDAGRLEQSRIVEGLTPLLIGINIRNKAHAGIHITGLA
ncbi:NADPH-dependent F420 reductase [Patulibacter medicamentivorans]|uniref:NADPH-dependent F420 reductase n=1 Tax=Patulibacter medicamentivorans TaxID=1097667 RepID=UPI00058C096A|nr:NADPH-dependent F420 reductase [Patulibacter medicamentivorans]